MKHEKLPEVASSTFNQFQKQCNWWCAFSTPIVLSHSHLLNVNLESSTVLTAARQRAGASLINNFYPTAAHVVQQSVDDGILIFVQRSF